MLACHVFAHITDLGMGMERSLVGILEGAAETNEGSVLCLRIRARVKVGLASLLRGLEIEREDPEGFTTTLPLVGDVLKASDAAMCGHGPQRERIE